MNVYVTRNVEVNNGNMRRPVEIRGVLLYDKEKYYDTVNVKK